MTDDYVVKRNGTREVFSFDKILKRVKTLGNNELTINYTSLVQKIIDRLYDGIPTTKIDELTAQQCASLITTHHHYGILASRIMISNHHKNTEPNFLNVITELYNFRDIHKKHHPLIHQDIYELTNKYHEELEKMIDYKRDYLIDFFGFKTLERAYLMRINNKILERPQHMWMRVALSIHKNNLEKVRNTYNAMSNKYFTHATPTLFNAGTPRPQLSSCYLLGMKDDSIAGIYETLTDCAKISKWAGGIGLHIHNVRAAGSHIRGTNGTSNGIVPMLRVFNDTARYVDQCILPETYIYTLTGPKQIQYCTNDDIIYNSNKYGKNYEKIQNILEHSYDGEVLSIHTTHSIEPLIITNQHPILILKNQQKGLNYKVICNRLKNKLITPIWEDAKNITEQDFIIYNIPSYEKNIKYISEEDCYIYGVILGDGCISNTESTCYISLHKTKKKYILDKLINYFTNKYIRYTITDAGDNCTRFRWCKNTSLPFKYSEIYDINKEKILHSRWLNLPINKVKNIIKGLIDTDGCKNKELTFDSTSRNLIESMKYLFLRMGILTSGYIRDRRGETHISKYGCKITNKKISYCLRIPKTIEVGKLLKIEPGKFFKFFKYDTFLFSRIKSIEKKTYTGTLYDLQMKDTHNYMIHNGLIHNGGGKRNGSFAIYLEPWHKDIKEFLDMKKTHGDEEARARDLFYALWIPDLFMKRVSKGEKWTLMCPDQCPGLSDVYGDEFDTLYKKYESEGKGETVNARDIWFKVLDSQIETGTPYMLYKDACNKKSNQKNLGTIKSSNLCVSPETLILTDKGHIEIQTLKNKKVNIWNGKEFSETTIKQTSDNSELITIAFSDGSELTCTKYHKFYIQMKYPTSKMKQDIIKSKHVSIIEAQNLKPNMKLIKCEYPIIDNKKELKSAYTNGIFSADGTYTNISEKEERKCNFKSLEGKSFCKRHIDYQRNDEVNEYCCGISYTKKPHITLYGEKIKLLEYLDYRSIGEKKDNKLNVTLPVDLKDKFFVPMNYSLKSKLDWVAGYCDGDGSIARNGTNQSLQIACIHKEFLLKIKLMLQTCGIASKVTLNMNERLSKLPDGKGGLAYYKSKKLWRLLVGSNDLQKLVELGFTPKRLIINKHEPQRNATQFIKVSKITDNNRTDKTFCFNEPLRHAGIFNGVISSQCTEIIEYSDDKETAVCNLASLGLPKFVEFPNPNFEEVIFYSKPNCVYCELAKNHLLKFGIYFTHIVLDCDETRHEIYNKLTKDYKLESQVNSVPQILIDGEYIGGYLELIKKVKPEFNYEKLHSMTKIVTENLNKVIDINFYPTEKTKRSNFLHRPIGIGVQGLADTFALMNIPFYSDDAKEVNKNIFETIYHAALEQSNETSMERMKDMKVLKNIIEKIGYPSVSEPNPDPHALINTDKFYSWNSEEEGENLKHTLDTLINLRKPIYNEVKNLEGDVLGSYSSFIGSPTSKGILQFDMWDVTPSKRYDWDKLKESVKQYGIRNSLLLAPMPTASTSQILGNNECFEPFTSNIYVRRTIAGEFIVANKHLMEELINIGKWDENIKDSIIANQGSIQHLKLPQHIKNKYKIVWEIPMKHILNMAKDRGVFIDQSQSTNLWMKDPTYEKLTAMHFYAWKLGLKTGLYYLRTKAKATAQQFTIDPNLKNKIQMEQDIHEPCEMCSG